jgi:hypothetical protein
MSVADASVILPASALDELFEAPDLSDLDPSTHGGFKIVYHREVPLEMRLQTTDVAPAEAGTLEAIACKICVREGEDGRPKQVKVELSSEGDLFFSYTHIVDERQFNAMRDEQKLMVDFASYPSVLASSFTNAIKVSAGSLHIAVVQLRRCLGGLLTVAPHLRLCGRLAGAAHLPGCVHHEPRRSCSP